MRCDPSLLAPTTRRNVTACSGTSLQDSRYNHGEQLYQSEAHPHWGDCTALGSPSVVGSTLPCRKI